MSRPWFALFFLLLPLTLSAQDDRIKRFQDRERERISATLDRLDGVGDDEIWDVLSDLEYSAPFDREKVIAKAASLLDHADQRARRRAAFLLADLNAKEYLPEVAALLDDPESSVRNDATIALTIFHESSPEQTEQYLPRIVEAMDGTEFKFVGIQAIGRMKARAYSDVLIGHLQTPDVIGFSGANRIAVTTALGEIGNPEHLEHILPGLTHSNAGVRAASARAVAALGVKETIPDLVRLLEDPELRVQAAAIQSLRDLGSDADTSAAEGRIRAKMMEDFRSDKFFPLYRAFRSFYQFPTAEATGRIFELLDHPDPFVVEHALDALNRTEVSIPQEKLDKLLENPAARVRIAAHRMLVSSLKKPEGREGLLGTVGSLQQP